MTDYQRAILYAMTQGERILPASGPQKPAHLSWCLRTVFRSTIVVLTDAGWIVQSDDGGYDITPAGFEAVADDGDAS